MMFLLSRNAFNAMSDNDKALAPASTSAVTFGGPMPEGFENLEASDLVVPRIRLWHPQSDISPDGVKLGDYVDLMAKASIGNSIEFFIVAQKGVTYENDKKEKDGTISKVLKNEKHLLSVLAGNFNFPRRIEFSSAGIREVKRILSHLFVTSQQQGGKPLFSWLIRATSETLTNSDNGGKFAAPLLEVLREATEEELAKLRDIHKQFVPDFLAKREDVHAAAPVEKANPDDLPFGNSEKAA